MPIRFWMNVELKGTAFRNPIELMAHISQIIEKDRKLNKQTIRQIGVIEYTEDEEEKITDILDYLATLTNRKGR